MLTEPQVSTTLEGRCSGCGHEYPWESLPFLYADELGHRCPGCGSVLLVDNTGDPHGKVREPCRLMLSGRLEGSGLHGRLVELVRGRGGLRVLVDRMGETRTVRLVSSVSAMESVAEEEAR